MDDGGLAEEIEVLKSIYIDELQVHKNDRDEVSLIQLQLHPATGEDLNQRFVCMTLILDLTDEYPDVPPEITIRNPRGISEEELLSLREDMHKLCEDRRGGPMLFELIELAKDSLTAGNIPHCPCMICLEHFTEGEKFTKTECYHYFHEVCLSRYIHHVLTKTPEVLPAHTLPDPEKNKLTCPVCREVIKYELEDFETVPPEDKFEFTPTAEMRELQTKMAEILERQKARGGIIDVEAEKNKFLVKHDDVVLLALPKPKVNASSREKRKFKEKRYENADVDETNDQQSDDMFVKKSESRGNRENEPRPYSRHGKHSGRGARSSETKLDRRANSGRQRRGNYEDGCSDDDWSDDYDVIEKNKDEERKTRRSNRYNFRRSDFRKDYRRHDDGHCREERKGDTNRRNERRKFDKDPDESNKNKSQTEGPSSETVNFKDESVKASAVDNAEEKTNKSDSHIDIDASTVGKIDNCDSNKLCDNNGGNETDALKMKDIDKKNEGRYKHKLTDMDKQENASKSVDKEGDENKIDDRTKSTRKQSESRNFYRPHSGRRDQRGYRTDNRDSRERDNHKKPGEKEVTRDSVHETSNRDTGSFKKGGFGLPQDKRHCAENKTARENSNRDTRDHKKGGFGLPKDKRHYTDNETTYRGDRDNRKGGFGLPKEKKDYADGGPHNKELKLTDESQKENLHDKSDNKKPREENCWKHDKRKGGFGEPRKRDNYRPSESDSDKHNHRRERLKDDENVSQQKESENLKERSSDPGSGAGKNEVEMLDNSVSAHKSDSSIRKESNKIRGGFGLPKKENSVDSETDSFRTEDEINDKIHKGRWRKDRDNRFNDDFRDERRGNRWNRNRNVSDRYIDRKRMNQDYKEKRQSDSESTEDNTCHDTKYTEDHSRESVRRLHINNRGHEKDDHNFERTRDRRDRDRYSSRGNLGRHERDWKKRDSREHRDHNNKRTIKTDDSNSSHEFEHKADSLRNNGALEKVVDNVERNLKDLKVEDERYREMTSKKKKGDADLPTDINKGYSSENKNQGAMETGHPVKSQDEHVKIGEMSFKPERKGMPPGIFVYPPPGFQRSDSQEGESKHCVPAPPGF